MGTKQNFKTALNELMAGKLAVDDADVSEAEESAASAKTEAPAQAPTPAPVAPAEPVFKKPSYTSTFSTPTAAAAVSNISILSSDLVIEGNIKSTSDIRIDGYVKGNVYCDGSIACGGAVEGDVSCDSLVLTGCSINGNVSAKSDITVDPDSTVIGDVAANNLVSNGRIKGNIHTTGSTTLREKAMLMGNINAKSISLDAGASLKGTLEIQTADLSDRDFSVDPISPIAPAAAKSAVRETIAAPQAAAAAAPTVTTPPPAASVSSTPKPVKKPSFPVFEQSFANTEKK